MNEHVRHSMDFSNLSAAVTTIASTLINTTATTVMPHDMHHSHDETVADVPAGHSIIDHSIHLLGAGSVDDQGLLSSDHPLMYFHSGVDAVILFKEWSTSSAQGVFGSVIAIFLMAMLYEGIKFFREYMFKKYFTSLEYSSVSVLGDDGKTVTEVHRVARNRMFSWPHTMQTMLHMVQMVLSYFLMLIFMTYNVWLCLGVVLGAGMGYFLFGWKKATVVDITEHCH